MITSPVQSSYFVKESFKLSSGVRQISVAKMDVSLNSRLLEKSPGAAVKVGSQNQNESEDLAAEAHLDRQCSSYRGELEFCHQHLVNIVI